MRTAACSAMLLLVATSAGATTRVWSLRGSVEALGVVPTEFRDDGRQYPSANVAIAVDARPTSSLRFHLETSAGVDGTARSGDVGIYGFRQVFQHRLAGLDVAEAYVDATAANFGLRIGVQLFNWGKLDVFSPNDVLSPLEGYDPLLSGLSGIRDSKIGVPAVRLGYYRSTLPPPLPGELAAEIVVQPLYVPPRYDYPGERWFPPTLLPREEVIVAGIPVQTRISVANRASPWSPQLASRLAISWSGLDLELFQYWGHQTGFVGDTTARLHQPALPDGLVTATANVALRPDYSRMLSLGAAAASEIGPFTVRAEVAWQHDRAFLRETTALLRGLRVPPGAADGAPFRLTLPVTLLSDAVEGGIGVDYAYAGWIFMLQVGASQVLSQADQVLGPAPEVRVIGSVRKTFLSGRLQASVSALHGILGGDTFVEPLFTYALGEHWSVSAGYLLLAGPPDTLFGQFRANDEFFLKARFVW